MRDELLGTTQPVLSISLDPGESVVAEVGEFAWMTDSIEMAAGEAPRLVVYTATDEPGVVAFASKRPGCILGVDVGPGQEGYLVRESSFLAGTPGVRVSPGEGGLALRRICGSGRAWVELGGDVVRRELAAGQSLRAHPRHIGMVDATVAIQVAVVHGTSGHDAHPCAVLSGPGAVWLQSTAQQSGAGP
jgi:uncharacterized protein (AIM24 family)